MSAPGEPSTDNRAPDETAVRPADLRPGSTERFTPGTLLASRYRIIAPLGKLRFPKRESSVNLSRGTSGLPPRSGSFMSRSNPMPGGYGPKP